MTTLNRGRATMWVALCDRLGYSEVKAQRVVNQFIEVLRKGLGEGKNIKLDGIGTLTIFKRKQVRWVGGALKNGVVKSLRTRNKQEKSIRIEKPTLKYPEE